MHKQLLEYIKTRISQGTVKSEIVAELLKSGWQQNDIDAAYTLLRDTTGPSVATIPQPATAQITETTYPVQFRWVWKSTAGFFVALVVSLILFMFGYYNFYLILLIFYTPIHFVVTTFRRKNFHYVLDTKFLVVAQGVVSKQQRNVPYGVIQNVFVKQDLFDRLFGLASLTIENAAQGAGSQEEGTTKFFGIKFKNQQQKKAEMIGFKGNKVNIPGLLPSHAEALKGQLLLKMKTNPLEDSQSGL